MPRECEWCHAEMPPGKRSHARFCSDAHRFAGHRFSRQVHAREVAEAPKRIGIFDPPYVGKAWLYEDHPDYAGEVDHAQLIDELRSFDGWALFADGAEQGVVARLFPSDLSFRTAIWVRGARGVRSRFPQKSFETIFYWPARIVPEDRRAQDSLVHFHHPRHTDPDFVIGAKPAAVCEWVFNLLSARVGDTLEDRFPGSGSFSRAWDVAVTKSDDPRQTKLFSVQTSLHQAS